MTPELSIVVELTLTQPLLGTCPANKQIMKDYVTSKRPPAPDGQVLPSESDDLPTVDEEIQKGTTVFRRDADKKTPCFMSYMIKGFMKDACKCLSRASGKDEEGNKLQKNISSKLKAYKQEIDGLIFPKPDKIRIEIPAVLPDNAWDLDDPGSDLVAPEKGETVGISGRPLRASTPQGERVTLVRSEAVPAGSKLRMTIHLLRAELEDAVYEWLDYGAWRGLGQWRNSGKGTFTYEIISGGKRAPKKTAAAK
jgi:hypothetical protein